MTFSLLGLNNSVDLHGVTEMNDRFVFSKADWSGASFGWFGLWISIWPEDTKWIIWANVAVLVDLGPYPNLLKQQVTCNLAQVQPLLAAVTCIKQKRKYTQINIQTTSIQICLGMKCDQISFWYIFLKIPINPLQIWFYYSYIRKYWSIPTVVNC